MSKLTILRGVPGSGKSTWAEAQAGNPVIVSRDRIRAAIFGTADQSYYSIPKEALYKRENFVTGIQDTAIGEALIAGMDVIVDNTNVEWKFVRAIADIGYKAGAEVEVKTFDISLRMAKERVAMRHSLGGRDVPVSVIERMHGQLQSSKDYELTLPHVPEPYHGTPGKPKAVLVDVDGTLAHMNGNRGPFEWHNVHVDEVDEAVRAVVNAIALTEEYHIIILSGRDGSCYDLTYDWLVKNYVEFDDLIMRQAGDMRKDSIVKSEIFDRDIRDNYDVQFVIDDRRQVVDMWLEMGIKVFNVAGIDGGNF